MKRIKELVQPALFPVETCAPLVPASSWPRPRIELVHGRKRVLERAAELLELAAGTGQQGEVEDLPYFLDQPTRVRYAPVLVLIHAPALVAAVLVYDTWLLFGRGKIFTSLSLRGRRSVFAPVARRLEAAALAAQALLERGAMFVNMDIDLGPYVEDPAAEARALAAARASVNLWLPGLRGVPVEVAVHNGLKRYDLALAKDFDTTLAAFGKQTRRNLRYYPRLCEADLGAVFVADVEISRAEFADLSQGVSFPQRRSVVNWRYDSFGRFPDLFLHGLRAADGTWLSLISGKRRRGEVVITWQMNRKGYGRYSLSTAMRALLIRHELAAGSTSLTLKGGTPHQMADGFRMRSVYNLAVRRPTWMLAVAAQLLLRFREEIVVTKALVKPWRVWKACWRSPGKGEERS